MGPAGTGCLDLGAGVWVEVCDAEAEQDGVNGGCACFVACCGASSGAAVSKHAGLLEAWTEVHRAAVSV